MKTTYSVEITGASKELTAREKIYYKKYDDAIKLDEVITEDGTKFIITPVEYVCLSVFNEKAKSQNYDVIVIKTVDGTRYSTGSNSFISAFLDIFNEIGNDEEPFEIEIYKRPSKNFTGKCFITCNLHF